MCHQTYWTEIYWNENTETTPVNMFCLECDQKFKNVVDKQLEAQGY